MPGSAGSGRRRVIVAGAGIGGLAAALELHRRGVDVQVYESVAEIRPLGVGINLLPHAMAKLADLELLDVLVPRGVPTAELCFYNRHGQLIWREPRGLAAGYPVPQLSIHRGILQQVLLDAVRDRIGTEAVRTGAALESFEDATNGRVEVTLRDRADGTTFTDSADVLVGADGIHSRVRSTFHPDEGPPNWQGDVLSRSTTVMAPFLTGRSMFMAGHLPHKFVAYPITEPDADGLCVINWIAELDRSDEGLAHREDWNRIGDPDDFASRFDDWTFDWLDIPALIKNGDTVYEFPMVDRDPLPRWTFGRVTLLGDAAHPMFPIGSNGASQAILDAHALAVALAGAEDVGAALARYEDDRRPSTSTIVLANRQHGPERVLDLAEGRAPDGFDHIDDVFAPGELEGIAAQYRQIAGFARSDDRPR